MPVDRPDADRICGCTGHTTDALRRSVLGGAIALALAPFGATSAAPDPRAARPQPGDHLVYSEGDLKGQRVKADTFAVGDRPVFAYPVEPSSGTVRDGNRLNLVLLVCLEPAAIGPKTLPLATDGIVAYSAVCTHYGCQVSLLHENRRAVVCNCHGSTFDVGNNGEIVGGPATRRLAILPLKQADGALVVAAGFSGRLGPPTE